MSESQASSKVLALYVAGADLGLPSSYNLRTALHYLALPPLNPDGNMYDFTQDLICVLARPLVIRFGG